jgi:hypothetical protein
MKYATQPNSTLSLTISDLIRLALLSVKESSRTSGVSYYDHLTTSDLPSSVTDFARTSEGFNAYETIKSDKEISFYNLETFKNLLTGSKLVPNAFAFLWFK